MEELTRLCSAFGKLLALYDRYCQVDAISARDWFDSHVLEVDNIHRQAKLLYNSLFDSLSKVEGKMLTDA